MSIKFVSQFSSLSPAPEATLEIVQESSHTNSASGTTQQEQQTIAEGTWNFIWPDWHDSILLLDE